MLEPLKGITSQSSVITIEPRSLELAMEIRANNNSHIWRNHKSLWWHEWVMVLRLSHVFLFTDFQIKL